MRFTLIVAAAMLLTPVALSARAAAPGLHGAVTDVSAAKKKKAPTKKTKKTEEYLKAAPGTGPSGPKY